MATPSKQLGAGLLDACDDPKLFGVKLWPNQRKILSSIEGGPTTHVLCCGRRASKTYMGSLTATWDACLSPELQQFTHRREKRYCVSVANNIAQARLFVSFARMIVEASPLLSKLVVSASDDRIEFSTGAVIAAFPCSARGARGWPISTLFLDEFAHHVDGDGNSAAESVWKSMVPSTYQFRDTARIIVASTPWGETGKFAELYAQVQAGEREGVVHHYSSPELNPTLDPAMLSREFEADPDGFRTEVLAEFVASGGSYFDRSRIEQAVVDRGDLDRLEIVDPIIGIDVAFRNDPMACVVVGRDPKRPELLRVAAIRTWAPERTGSFGELREVEDRRLQDVVEVARYYGEPSTRTAARVVGDNFLAAPVRQFFQDNGVPVKTVALRGDERSSAFDGLRSRLYSGLLELPRHQDLLRELRTVKTVYRGGRSTVALPRTARGHNDIVAAITLAVSEHDKRGVGPAAGAKFVPLGRFDFDPSDDLARLHAEAMHGLSKSMRL